MDLGRLRGTDYVVGVLAAGLLGSLFLDWYAPLEGIYLDASGDVSDPDVVVSVRPALDAWEAYAVTDVVLAAFAVMSLGIVVVTAVQRTPAVPVAWTALTAALSLAATGFMVAAALTVPEGGYAREVGPTVGLALTLALAGAVWSTLRSERPGPSFVRSGRADVEALPAPRP